MPAVFSFVFRSLDSGSRSRTRSREPNRNMLLRIKAKHRDPVHGVEGGLEDKEKEQEGKSQDQHRASPGRIQGMLQGKAGTKRVQKKDLH